MPNTSISSAFFLIYFALVSLMHAFNAWTQWICHREGEGIQKVETTRAVELFGNLLME